MPPALSGMLPAVSRPETAPASSGPASIVVVGSLVADLVVHVPALPRAGQTVMATRAQHFLGGKGFNQAVAAARLGAAVSMIGKVGEDSDAAAFRRELRRSRVDAAGVTEDPAGTGFAMPMVDPSGDNMIVLVPRANHHLGAADVERSADPIRAADTILLQLEVPLAASLAAARLARRANTSVVWNLAPWRQIPPGKLDGVTVVVNEAEAADMLGIEVPDTVSAPAVAAAIQRSGPAAVVITLGPEGAAWADASGSGHVPGFQVDAVDTVGCGDAFCAALAVASYRATPFAEAVRFANAAGAHAATIEGAGPAMPRREDVAAVLSSAPRRR